MSWPHLGGDPTPRGTTSPSEHQGMRAVQRKGKPAPGRGNSWCPLSGVKRCPPARMVPSPALTPSMQRAQEGAGACTGLPGPSTTVIYISTAQRSIPDPMGKVLPLLPSPFVPGAGGGPCRPQQRCRSFDQGCMGHHAHGSIPLPPNVISHPLGQGLALLGHLN